MKRKSCLPRSFLIEIAGVGLLTAFASSNAFAQEAVTPPSAGPWTASNVSAAQPFGAIDIAAAGASGESVRTWSQGRTYSERIELNGRCRVISDPANAARYPANAQQFCRNYMMIGSAARAPGEARYR